MFFIEPNVLAIGLGNKSEVLEELPIRFFVMDTTVGAMRCLHEEKIDMVIGQWELPDMPNGLLFKRIREAKPAISTIAFIRPGDREQETIARNLGISVVLNEDVDDPYFCEVTCDMLRIPSVAQIDVTDSYNFEIDHLL